LLLISVLDKGLVDHRAGMDAMETILLLQPGIARRPFSSYPATVLTELSRHPKSRVLTQYSQDGRLNGTNYCPCRNTDSKCN
jgi:hypothetical protein